MHSKDKEELFDYIKSVDWSQFDTAYGHADMVNYFYNPPMPNMETVLERLFSDDRELAIRSSGDVGAFICHQNCFISTAAQPVCDVLIYALKTLDDVLREELTLTAWGLVSLIPKDQPEGTWQWEIRKRLIPITWPTMPHSKKHIRSAFSCRISQSAVSSGSTGASKMNMGSWPERDRFCRPRSLTKY